MIPICITSLSVYLIIFLNYVCGRDVYIEIGTGLYFSIHLPRFMYYLIEEMDDASGDTTGCDILSICAQSIQLISSLQNGIEIPFYSSQPATIAYCVLNNQICAL